MPFPGLLTPNFGLYPPNKTELPTTVTELIAIAAPATGGNHPNSIFDTVFFPKSIAVATSLKFPFIRIIPLSP